MCKNMMVVGVPHSKSDELWKFLIAATPFMSAADKDGVGYVASSPGGLWGERWLLPSDAWVNRPNKLDKRVTNTLKQVISRAGSKGDGWFSEFGSPDSKMAHAVMLHTRMATCDKGMKNTHPFVQKEAALIHNGVINNAKDIGFIDSTCDSESILKLYQELDVANNPEKISELTKKIQGYWCVGLLGKAADGVEYMDIFRSYSAGLHVAFIKELNANVFCTRAEIIESAVDKLKYTMSNAYEIEAGKMLRLNARTGELINVYDCEFSGYSTSNASATSHFNQSEYRRHGSY